MPVPRELSAELARNLARLFGDAEERLAAALARQVREDLRDAALPKLNAYRRLRESAESILRALTGPARALAEEAVLDAFASGAHAAVNELTRAGTDRWVDWAARRSRIVRGITRLTGIARRRNRRLQTELDALRGDLPGVDSIMALVGELTQRMSSTHLRVLRWDQDAYRDVMAAATLDVLAGTKSRLRAGEVVMDRLLSQGITGFTDKAGRNWSLGAYVDMATRTTVAHAALEGAISQFRAAGVDLVTVSDAPQECTLCRPFEGKILSLVGPAGPRQVEHGITDGLMVTVDVHATLGDAVLRGLFHPNCRHSLGIYLPGVTRLPTGTEDPKGDADRQELRRLERETRRAKRRAAGAMTPEGRAARNRVVRRREAQIRQHIEDTGLHRQPHREAVDYDGPAPEPGTIPDPRPPATPDRTPAPATEAAPTLPDPVNLEGLAARSDDDLFGLFSQYADRPDVLAPILAELERRDQAAAASPDPLEGINLEGLGERWLDHYAREHADRPDILDRITAERDRRAAALRQRATAAAAEVDTDRAPRPEPARPADLTPEQARVEDLVDAGKSWQQAYAEVYDLDDTDLDQQTRAAAIDAERALGETREDTIRRLYREYVHLAYLAAEDATRGHMLSPAGRNARIDPKTLFSGNAARARKYASADLLEWFDTNGRMTYTQYRTELFGHAEHRRGQGV
ncbi:phage minor capsid protein [Glycomyces sp. NPDC046736]|uniref:phage minor capsid protein n=1 Tax=Glycomyces sp. NPDC046736 TaxID=3155615 RepID=UPI0033D3C532